MRDEPKPKGGKRPGAGRKRSSPDGLLRRSRTFTVTDTEWMYLRTALEYYRTLSSNAPGQCATNPDERAE